MEASREAIAFIIKGSRCRVCLERSFYIFVRNRVEIVPLAHRDRHKFFCS